MEEDEKWGAWERQKDGEEKKRGGKGRRRHKRGRKADGKTEGKLSQSNQGNRQHLRSIICVQRVICGAERQPGSGLGCVTSPPPTAKYYASRSRILCLNKKNKSLIFPFLSVFLSPRPLSLCLCAGKINKEMSWGILQPCERQPLCCYITSRE